MGPAPSFIIQPAAQYQTQFTSPQQTKRLFISKDTGFTLTHIKPMAFGYYVAEFSSQSPTHLLPNLPALTKALESHNAIDTVIPNCLSSIHAFPSEQWHFNQPPGGIALDAAWDAYGKGTNQFVAAVLDTGILEHDAISQNILLGVYFNHAGEYGHSASPPCKNCPGVYHGTAVAGIISSTGHTAYGKQLSGIAPYTPILPINLFTAFYDEKTCGHPPCLFAYLSDQINALAWLEGHAFKNLPTPPDNIKVINLSLGHKGDCPKLAKEAFLKLQEKGISVVVAAGNQGIDAASIYPANCEATITVAATGKYGELASYSNFGENITLAAPGGNAAYSITTLINHGYRSLQGTSLAAPHVTGVISLMYAVAPDLSTQQVKDILNQESNVTAFPSKLPTRLKPCSACGVGIVNAYKTLRSLKNHSLDSQEYYQGLIQSSWT